MLEKPWHRNAEREHIKTSLLCRPIPSTLGCRASLRDECAESAAPDAKDFELTANLALCTTALLVEALAGYPAWLFDKVGHPVTWMGRLLSLLDRRLNRNEDTAARRRMSGTAALAVLLLASGAAAWGLSTLVNITLPGIVGIGLLAIVASSCLAQRSLHAHVQAVVKVLERDDLPAARRAVAAIVGRDTAELDAAGISRAAIESLAENFADGIVAPAFWLALLGLPGGILYKAVNTADSMIGHRSPRHEAFGFCAAKLDDAVNWPAARLAALWLVLAAALVPGGSTRDAYRVMLRDAAGHPSPNAGWPEAAMGGALGIRLGGPRAYAGCTVEDAVIGDGDRVADAATIRAALSMYRAACSLQIAGAAIAWFIIARWL